MKIKMTHQMSGLRDGKPWPEPGKTIDLPKDEAVVVLNSGMAEPVRGKATPETAEADNEAETAETDEVDETSVDDAKAETAAKPAAKAKK